MKVPLLLELMKVFGRIGSVGFGGPIALIALMEAECCEKRKWVTVQEFNETFVICKLFPGPMAYQMAVWLGHRHAGKLGGLVAGVSFFFPGMVMILLMAVFYQSLSHLSLFEVLSEGMRLGALVIIFDSVLRMAKPYAKEVLSWVLAILAMAAMFVFPRWEPIFILMGGVLAVFLAKAKKREGLPVFVFPALSVLFDLFWVHFKAGAFVFGTGLAIIPFLQHESVEVFQWLSLGEFLDGIAFGQITPGPVTITSAFIGWKVAGLVGAMMAVTGMYLPGLCLVLFLLPLVQKRSKQWSWLGDFQKGAIPTVIGCIVGAAILLGRQSLNSPTAVGIFAILFLTSLKMNLPAWAYIPFGCGLKLLSLLVLK